MLENKDEDIILKRVVREDLPEKVTFDQRSKESGGCQPCRESEKKYFRQGEQQVCKSPEIERATTRRPLVLEPGEGGEE